MNGVTMTPELAARFREVEEAERAAYGKYRNDFLSMCQTGKADRLGDCLEGLRFHHSALSEAFAAASRLPKVSPTFKRALRDFWIANGNSLRGDFPGGDLELMTAFRRLMPTYIGPGVRLYRGDSFINRKRRTYGLAWSASRRVAEAFATGTWQAHEGGSVLLETDAPPEAIICKFNSSEREYLIDRRKLGPVLVVKRFEQKKLLCSPRSPDPLAGDKLEH